MDRKESPGLAIEVELERETYQEGTDPLCRGVVRFHVPPDSLLLEQRIRTHICVVLDVSGSMDEPSKYPMLLQALRLLCDGLVEGQHLTVIAFSSDAAPVATMVDHREARRDIEQIIDRIDRCWFRFGGTELSPALGLAVDELQRGHRRWPGMVQRLYVLTDGQLDDAVDSLRYSHYLEQLDVEFGSYGFGDDFALETMRAIIGNCLGGGVKRIADAAALQETFRHLARVGQRVVSPRAELELALGEGVIAGDAFWHRPIARWLRRDEDADGTSVRIPVGPIEARRSYVLAFEARVTRANGGELGRAILRCTHGDRELSFEVPIVVRFGGEADGPVRPMVREVLDDVAALREDDPDTLLRAYRGRLAIFRREYRDPESIGTLERAIETLEQTGSLETLPDDARREIDSDRNTIMVEDRTEDPAASDLWGWVTKADSDKN